MEPVEPEQRSGKRAALLYAALFVCFQLGAVLVLLAVMVRPWFLTHDGYPGVYQAGYGMRLEHADCDVVLYGDSSALTGLDPQLIAKMTGLKTCNIAEARGVEDVVGLQFPLDAYLRKNKRPRFILILLGPTGYLPDKKPFTDYSTEGMIYVLQYDHGREMLQGLKHRPRWLMDFTFWAGQSIVENELKQLLPWTRRVNVDTRKQRADRDGMWPYPLPPEVNCNYSKPDLNIPAGNAEDVAATRTRYAVDGTQVVLDISPISDCSPYRALFQKQLDGLHDNALVTLPMSYFNDADVHFTPIGSAYISTEAANQILALMGQDDAGKLNRPAAAAQESKGSISR
jgi:hypothetical protein